MRKLLSGGLAVFAGVVSLPMSSSTQQVHKDPVADYRNDPRFGILSRFFANLHCPVQRYSAIFLEAADLYELDWRLLPSISFVESTGGKSAKSNNIFGWNSGRAEFPTPAAAIHEVGYQLANSKLYKSKTLDKILATYNPNAEYAQKVKSVMRRIAPTE
jgi:hypothetical protein